MLSVTQIHSCLSSTRSLAYTNTAINEMSALMKGLMESVVQSWIEDQGKRNVIYVNLFYFTIRTFLRKKENVTKE